MRPPTRAHRRLNLTRPTARSEQETAPAPPPVSSPLPPSPVRYEPREGPLPPKQQEALDRLSLMAEETVRIRAMEARSREVEQRMRRAHPLPVGQTPCPAAPAPTAMPAAGAAPPEQRAGQGRPEERRADARAASVAPAPSPAAQRRSPLSTTPPGTRPTLG